MLNYVCSQKRFFNYNKIKKNLKISSSLYCFSFKMMFQKKEKKSLQELAIENCWRSFTHACVSDHMLQTTI